MNSLYWFEIIPNSSQVEKSGETQPTKNTIPHPNVIKYFKK